MSRKTIYRYEWRCFQKANQGTGQSEHYRLSPDPNAGISGNRSGHWSITWLAERWVIDFPDGLHRQRFSPADEPRYRIGRREFACELIGVVHLASVGKGGARIVKHETFPEPGEARPSEPDE